MSYVLAWEIENHFLSDAPGDRNDQLTEKEDFPSKMPISCTKNRFQQPVVNYIHHNAKT